MNEQLKQLIEQYERETKYLARINPPFNNSFNDRFVEWLASRPTCGVEQRKFLDEVESKLSLEPRGKDSQFVWKGKLLTEGFWDSDFDSDINKVIKGE